jgi:hypothetical protein
MKYPALLQLKYLGSQGFFFRSALFTAKQHNRITAILKSFFDLSAKGIFSIPYFRFTSGKLIISVFFYKPLPINSEIKGQGSDQSAKSNRATAFTATHGSDLLFSQEKMNILGDLLNREVNKVPASPLRGGGQNIKNTRPRGIELHFIQLHYPYLDSYILAKYLAINSYKNKFARMHKTVFNLANLDSTGNGNLVTPSTAVLGKPSLSPAVQSLTGIKLQVSGRLPSQKSIPRKSVYTAFTGTFKSSTTSPLGAKNVINYNKFTSKNRIGAFTVKV